MKLPSDFRGQLPLSDFDFARIRRNVLSKVARRETPRFAFALRFAVALMVAAFVGVVSYRAPRPPVEPPAPRNAGFQPAGPPASSRPPAAAPRPRRLEAGAPEPKPTHKIIEPEIPIRLEIQTADPDVRIIWFTNPSNEEKS